MSTFRRLIATLAALGLFFAACGDDDDEVDTDDPSGQVEDEGDEMEDDDMSEDDMSEDDMGDDMESDDDMSEDDMGDEMEDEG